MRLVQLAVGSVNATVGAVRSNTDRCIRMAHDMAAAGTTLGALPEQVLGGYPPEDLPQWRAFVAAQRAELVRFAAETSALHTVFVLGLCLGLGGELFNAAAVVHRGRVIGLVPKEELPTYHVFYEGRVFSRGRPHLLLDDDGVPVGDHLFAFDFGVVAVEVCEDLWSPDGPMRRRCFSGAEVVVNVSASPYRSGVVETRREVIATRAADNQATVVYANLYGANDGLVFDGGGLVNQNGRLLLDAPRWREGFGAVVVDLDRTLRLRREATTWRGDLEAFRRERRPVPVLSVDAGTGDRSRLRFPAPAGGSFFLPDAGAAPQPSPRDRLLDDLFEALALGVGDYFDKVGAFTRLGVALSGGRDSLLTLLVAWHSVTRRHPALDAEALRREVSSTLVAFWMPTRHSSEATRRAAARIAEELSVPLRVVSLEDAFDREVEATRSMLGPGGELPPVTVQNIQARLRGTRMWNWANSERGLFLQTGNMSEKAVGYTTLGGDLEGGLSPIANLPKTVVIALLERLERRFGFEGIRLALETVAGPELAPDQSGEAELMPFAVLDACLHLYAGEKLAADEVTAALPHLFPERPPEELRAWAERFARLFTGAIFKWVQSPLSLHLGALDLDRERALQLPVVERNEWRGG